MALDGDQLLAGVPLAGLGQYPAGPDHIHPIEVETTGRPELRDGRSMDDVEVVITPTSDAPEAIEGFAEIGVTRLILPLGSQRAEKLEARLQQVAQLIRDFS